MQLKIHFIKLVPLVLLSLLAFASPSFAQLDADHVGGAIPTELHPGEIRRVEITMQNTGNEAWIDSPFRLQSITTPVDRWGVSTYLLDDGEIINPTESKTFIVYLEAPLTPGTYESQWQMKDTNGPGLLFGEIVLDDIWVDESVIPEWDAVIIDHDFPTEMFPGEPRLVTVTVENTGAGDWTGDRFALAGSKNTPPTLWDTEYYLMLGDTETVAPGEERSFTFLIKAPSPPVYPEGMYDCVWQMIHIHQFTYFGELLTQPVDVSSSITPELGSVVTANTIPSDMYPGETRNATLTFENTGTTTWDETNVRLYAPTSMFGTNRIYTLGSGETVNQGESKTFTVVITAPGSEGTYDCEWTMQGFWEIEGVNQFKALGEYVSVPVNVDNAIPPALDAILTGDDLPAQMDPDQVVEVNITLENTGTMTWDGSDPNWIRLRTQNSPAGLWTTYNIPLDGSDSIAPAQTKTFTFNITAPSSPGAYQCRWQLQKHWPNPNTFFGELVDVPVQVGAVAEICDDGIDNDGDTDIDCEDSDCDGELCDDDDACTTGETCTGSVCGGSSAVDCDDGNVCTDDSCDSVDGCEYTNNTDPCDDGLYCNGADTCGGGSCTHAGDPCTPPDACDEDTDSCGSPVEICDDGIDNDGDTDIDCEDSDCDGETCDDGDACTTGETCSGAVCEGGSAVDCDDSNDCTNDSCVPASGCEYTNNTEPCDDGVDCTDNDTCSGGTCNGTPNHANCEDGIDCTDDICDPVDDCQNEDNCPSGEICDIGDTDACIVTTTTTTSSPPTTTIPVPTCVVTITPDNEAVESGDTVSFSAITICNQVQVAGSYIWEIIPASSIGSEIVEGTGLYTAGTNDTASDVTDIIRVSDMTNNVTDTASVVVLSDIPTACTVVLAPASPTVNSGDTITFEATTEGDGCLEPDYEWSIDSDINSTINPDGSTCLYQSGINSTAMLQEDTITIIDSANDTTEEVSVTVSYGGIAAVFPRTLLSSRWLPLPQLMYIIGSNTGFNRTSQPSFTPDDDITTIGKIAFGRFLIVFVLVSREAEEGTIDVSVITTNSEGQEVTFTLEDATRIVRLPFMLDHKKFKPEY